MEVLEKTETRERILIAAHDLFYKYGIRSITMDDIARHLSVSKKTIYRFFNEKDRIVHACCTSDLDNHYSDCENIFIKSKDAVHEMMGVMKHVSEMFSRMNPNLFFDLQKFHPDSWKAFRNFKEQKMMAMVENNLKRGVKEGLYRPDINIKVLARLRIEEVELALNPVIFPPGKFNLKDVQVTLLDHFLHGITTLKGHKLINRYKQIKEEE
ncbi:MAG: TetR/AcrR family transcriptional regulator [Bacteroidia bacterium]